MAKAEGLLGAPEVAGAWINRPGTGKAVGGASTGNAISNAIVSKMVSTAAPTPGADTPDFGRYGYLALTETELVLMRVKQGLAGMKPVEIIARVPRNDVASATLGSGFGVAPFTLTFASGGAWDLEVAKARRRGAKSVVDALAL
jgi:hypothetical protein